MKKVKNANSHRPGSAASEKKLRLAKKLGTSKTLRSVQTLRTAKTGDEDDVEDLEIQC